MGSYPPTDCRVLAISLAPAQGETDRVVTLSVTPAHLSIF